MGYFWFFSQTDFLKKVLTTNPLNYYSLKITKFHGDGVINESAGTKINSLFRVIFVGPHMIPGTFCEWSNFQKFAPNKIRI